MFRKIPAMEITAPEQENSAGIFISTSTARDAMVKIRQINMDLCLLKKMYSMAENALPLIFFKVFIGQPR